MGNWPWIILDVGLLALFAVFAYFVQPKENSCKGRMPL
jgi:hypothetical protein